MTEDKYDDARDLLDFIRDRLANIDKALPDRPREAMGELACLEIRVAQLKQTIFEALTEGTDP